MVIEYKITYHELAVKNDIPRLSASVKKQIKSAIENKLTKSPEIFGKPLRKSLKGYRKLRVGNYRVVFEIEKDVIKILYIGHRSSIYEEASKNIRN